MMSMVGIEHTDFVNPNLTWGAVSKGNRSNSRRSRKSMSFDMKMSLGFLDKPQKSRSEEPSVSESEKLGVAVLGHRFGEKVENVPIKKRKFLLRTPSPPPRTHEKLESRVNGCAPAQCDSASNPEIVASLSNGMRSSSIDESGVMEKTRSAEDFSGIEMLAAAACNHILDDDHIDVEKQVGESYDLLKPSSSDDKLQWDLNTGMDEWKRPQDDIDDSKSESKERDDLVEHVGAPFEGVVEDDGYDSQFEDGELREESLAHCWEDSDEGDDGDCQHSDFESDNGDVSNELGAIDHATVNSSKSGGSIKDEMVNYPIDSKGDEGVKVSVAGLSSSNDTGMNSRSRVKVHHNYGDPHLSSRMLRDDDPVVCRSSSREIKRLNDINRFNRDERVKYSRFSSFDFRSPRLRSIDIERPIFRYRRRPFMRSPDIDGIGDYEMHMSTRNGRYPRARDGYYRSPSRDLEASFGRKLVRADRSFSPRYPRRARSRSCSPFRRVRGRGTGRGRFPPQKPRFGFDYGDDFVSPPPPRRYSRWAASEKHYEFVEAREERFRPAPRFALARVKPDRYFERKSGRFVGRWRRYDEDGDDRTHFSRTVRRYEARQLSYDDDDFEP